MELQQRINDICDAAYARDEKLSTRIILAQLPDVSSSSTVHKYFKAWKESLNARQDALFEDDSILSNDFKRSFSKELGRIAKAAESAYKQRALEAEQQVGDVITDLQLSEQKLETEQKKTGSQAERIAELEAALNQTKFELEQSKELHSKDLDKHTQEINALNDKHSDELSKLNDTHLEHIEKLESEHSETVEQHKNSTKQYESSIENLKGVESNLRSELAKSEVRVETKTQELQKVSDELSELETNMQKVKDELASEKTNSATHNAKREAVESELSKLEKSHTKLSKDYEALQIKYTILSANSSRLETELKSSVTNIETLKSSTESLSSEVSTLKGQVIELTKSKERVEAINAEKEAHIQQLVDRKK